MDIQAYKFSKIIFCSNFFWLRLMNILNLKYQSQEYQRFTKTNLLLTLTLKSTHAKAFP